MELLKSALLRVDCNIWYKSNRFGFYYLFIYESQTVEILCSFKSFVTKVAIQYGIFSKQKTSIVEDKHKLTSACATLLPSLWTKQPQDPPLASVKREIISSPIRPIEEEISWELIKSTSLLQPVSKDQWRYLDHSRTRHSCKVMSSSMRQSKLPTTRDVHQAV